MARHLASMLQDEWPGVDRIGAPSLSRDNVAKLFSRRPLSPAAEGVGTNHAAVHFVKRASRRGAATRRE